VYWHTRALKGAAISIDKPAIRAGAPRDLAIGQQDGAICFHALLGAWLREDGRVVFEWDYAKAFDSVLLVEANARSGAAGAVAVPALATNIDRRRTLTVAGVPIARPQDRSLTQGCRASPARLGLGTALVHDAILAAGGESVSYSDNGAASVPVEKVADVLRALQEASSPLGLRLKHLNVIVRPDATVAAQVRHEIGAWKVGDIAATMRAPGDVKVMGLGYTPGASRRIEAMRESLEFAQRNLDLFPTWLLAQFAMAKLGYDARSGASDVALAQVQALIDDVATRLAPGSTSDAWRAPASRGGLGLLDLHTARDLQCSAALIGMLVSPREYLAKRAWAAAAQRDSAEGFFGESLSALGKLGVVLDVADKSVTIGGERLTSPPSADALRKALQAALPAHAPEARPGKTTPSMLPKLIALTHRAKPRITDPETLALVRL